jgi:hypothetical protein
MAGCSLAVTGALTRAVHARRAIASASVGLAAILAAAIFSLR